MPQGPDGTKITQAFWNRLISSTPSAYTIYKDGSTYRAECLLSDGDDFTETSATTAIQSANDALTSGGKIFFKAATYPVTSVALSSNILVDGEKGAWLKATAAQHPFDLNNVSNVAIRNIGIDGDNIANIHGIYIRGSSNNILVSGIEAKQLRNGIMTAVAGSTNKVTVDSSLFHNMSKDGLDIEGCTDFIINQCICHTNDYMGIEVASSSKGSVSNCVTYGNTYSGLFSYDSHTVSWRGNLSRNNTEHGIYLCGAANSTGHSIVGNEFYDNTLCGIHLYPALRNTIAANQSYDNGTTGILLDPGSHYNNIVGNYAYLNVQNGITCYTASNNLIVGNYCYNNDSGDANSYVGIRLSTNSDNNYINGNYCYGSTQWRGIAVGTVDCADNIIVGNYLKGNKTLGGSDATGSRVSGYGNTWNRLVTPFVDGTACEDSGWDVDAGAEYARAFAFLPYELANIIRITIYARSMVTEADAMRLEIAMNSAANNEPYNTEAISVANKNSGTTNFAADDIIFWCLTSSDDADIADLTGGDSLEIKVLHEVAGNGDCATDARFKTVEIEYA